MNVRATLHRVVLQEDINFLLTNRLPRQLVTRFMGWFSRIEHPLVCRASIALWKGFADLDLSDAEPVRYKSLHDCFTRRLRDGARPFDADPTVLASPCDAIVGAGGRVEGLQVVQAKGFPYTLTDLFGSAAAAAPYRDGSYVTLRLTSSMYHRFHAPHDGTIEHVTYLSGDTWNVNPIALNRVERLFCRNERAVLTMRLTAGGQTIALVPVAAILVASIRLHFLNVLLHLRYRGPNELPCAAQVSKGEELGYFQHGSTIIVFAPPGFLLDPARRPGTRVRCGERLMHLPAA